ncbi:hypothetical protein P167DRAFT_392433 [Morchella conica CCBAS932]|uniref:Uncharacterized protein n=1 Tax=Morchella conica CCBAS932 TaxID=1392247 RepID=A0A3N4KB79_9PEZI|nr:hypothetical protein P167DRAFT_392433 [Morchella conica CCBAS932]
MRIPWGEWEDGGTNEYYRISTYNHIHLFTHLWGGITASNQLENSVHPQGRNSLNYHNLEVMVSSFQVQAGLKCGLLHQNAIQNVVMTFRPAMCKCQPTEDHDRKRRICPSNRLRAENKQSYFLVLSPQGNPGYQGFGTFHYIAAFQKAWQA